MVKPIQLLSHGLKIETKISILFNIHILTDCEIVLQILSFTVKPLQYGNQRDRTNASVHFTEVSVYRVIECMICGISGTKRAVRNRELSVRRG